MRTFLHWKKSPVRMCPWTQINKALQGLFYPHSWACKEQENGQEILRVLSNLNWIQKDVHESQLQYLSPNRTETPLWLSNLFAQKPDLFCKMSKTRSLPQPRDWFKELPLFYIFCLWSFFPLLVTLWLLINYYYYYYYLFHYHAWFIWFKNTLCWSLHNWWPLKICDLRWKGQLYSLQMYGNVW